MGRHPKTRLSSFVSVQVTDAQKSLVSQDLPYS